MIHEIKRGIDFLSIGSLSGKPGINMREIGAHRYDINSPLPGTPEVNISSQLVGKKMIMESIVASKRLILAVVVCAIAACNRPAGVSIELNNKGNEITVSVSNRSGKPIQIKGLGQIAAPPGPGIIQWHVKKSGQEIFRCTTAEAGLDVTKINMGATREFMINKQIIEKRYCLADGSYSVHVELKGVYGNVASNTLNLTR